MYEIEDMECLLNSKKSAENSSLKLTDSENNSKLEVNFKKNLDSKKNFSTDIVDVLKEKNERWTPQNWQKMLQNVRLMRMGLDAPVDTMGCHKCADEKADEKTQRFQTLVALMLSSQTKDEVIYNAMSRLKEHGLTASGICRKTVSELEKILYPISFYKNKAKYLHKTAEILLEKYDGDIPKDVKDLISLPGVGPKMAHICMAVAWNYISGIGVDVHVHRISNRLGWVEKPTKEPEQTRIALENWLPKELWPEINNLFVGFGQTTCTSFHPKCERCLNNSICPFVNKKEKLGTKLSLEKFESSHLKKSKVKSFKQSPDKSGLNQV